MGKGYPMYVQDTLEYKTVTQTYWAKCKSHPGETRLHAEAKRLFAITCRADPTIGANYFHNQVSVTSDKGMAMQPTGTEILGC